MLFLDVLVTALWRWWKRLRRVKKYRTWNLAGATVSTCKVIDDPLGERLQLTFWYELNAEHFIGLIVSGTRPAGTALRLEDDLLEGHELSIRVDPFDPASNAVLKEDNPQWPWEIQE